MAETTTVLLLERDLFFSVKIRDTLRHLDYETVVARNEDDFARKLAVSAPALAIINIATAGVAWERVIAQARAADVPVLAFGPHVDLEAQQQARQAGANRVVSNSKLAKDLPAIVGRVLAGMASGNQDEEPAEDEDDED
jgi:DNA-binding NarL/FixJ family response regulator